MNFNWKPEHLEMIRDTPHLLGHMIGKDKLKKMHSEWIKDVWDDLDHNGFQAHRGSYKTTAITEVGSIRWLLFHPNDRIAIIRKPYTEAAKTVATIKKYFQLEIIQSLFTYAHGFTPKLITGKENSLLFNFKQVITKEGNLDAYGTDSSLTGNHYDKILLDDIVTLKDRISKAEREKTKEALREIVTNIVDPGKQVMHVGTPWHKNDAWEIIPPKQKFTTADTNILSPEEIAEKKSKTTKTLYSINYDLKHIVSEEAIFTDAVEGNWSYSVPKVFAHLDSKYQGSHTGALTIFAKRPKDGKIQIIGWVFDENVKDKINWIVSICQRYKVRTLYTENNADKGYTEDLLNTKGLKSKGYHEKTNKHIKIVTYLKEYWNDLIWDVETDPNYLAQVLEYREGEEPDDAPDSAASGLREVFSSKTNMALWEA